MSTVDSPSPASDLTRARAAEDGPAPPGTGRLGGSGVSGPARPATPPAVAPPRTRRRPGLLAAGVALTALGALAAAYLTQVVGNTVPVVAVARSVPAGQVIDRADLAVADVAADPALQPIAAGRLDGFVGQRAAVDLSAGSLLTAQAVTGQVVPADGQSLVGVAVTSAQLPALALRPGDRVRVVDTPTAQGEPPSTTPAAIAGEIASVVGPDDTGLTVVNLLVAEDRAADLAARVATGRVALVLDSRERS